MRPSLEQMPAETIRLGIAIAVALLIGFAWGYATLGPLLTH
jgi:hypothetical protein